MSQSKTGFWDSARLVYPMEGCCLLIWYEPSVCSSVGFSTNLLLDPNIRYAEEGKETLLVARCWKGVRGWFRRWLAAECWGTGMLGKGFKGSWIMYHGSWWNGGMEGFVVDVVEYFNWAGVCLL